VSGSTSLRDGLRGRLAALAVESNEAEARIRNYETDTGHKAIAVAVKAHLTWRTAGHPSEEAAVAAALESCQVHYQEPCTLVAADEKSRAVAKWSPGGAGYAAHAIHRPL